MDQSFLYVGLACVVAAIVGGGLKALGGEVPKVKSLRRQILLAAFGLLLIVLSFFTRPTAERKISGLVFDQESNAPLGSVHVGLAASSLDEDVADDIMTTAPDGRFEFFCPRDIRREQYPLSFKLSRAHWRTTYTPPEKIAWNGANNTFNIPVDLSAVTGSPGIVAAGHVSRPMTAADAEERRGEKYWMGVGVERDYGKAFEAFKLASDQNHGQADANLGWIYENALGVPQDCGMAMKLYKKALDDGNARAAFNVGRLYDIGCGVPRDVNLARTWYEKGATAGVAEAQTALAALSKGGT